MSVAVLVLLAAAGCGKSEGPQVASAGGAATPSAGATTTASAGDREEQLRQFAGCMREHGVDVPDPQPGQTLAGAGGALNDPDFSTAFAACRSTLPNGGEPPKLSPDQVKIYLDFAACMREHGVDLPDPAPDGTLNLNLGSGRFNFTDPTFQAAIAACRDKFTGLRGTP
jgi:hypothetical protein